MFWGYMNNIRYDFMMILKEFPAKNQQLYLGSYNSECRSGGVFVCAHTHVCFRNRSRDQRR